MGNPYTISLFFQVPGELVQEPESPVVSFTRSLVFSTESEEQEDDILSICMNPQWGHAFIMGNPIAGITDAADTMANNMLSCVKKQVGCDGVLVPSNAVVCVVIGSQ